MGHTDKRYGILQRLKIYAEHTDVRTHMDTQTDGFQNVLIAYLRFCKI
jgi:hypothetical protein